MLKQIGISTNDIYQEKTYWKKLFETTLREQQ